MLLEAAMGAHWTMRTAVFAAVFLALTGHAFAGAFADTPFTGLVDGLVKENSHKDLVRAAGKRRSGTPFSKDILLRVAGLNGARQAVQAPIVGSPLRAVDARSRLAEESGSIDCHHALNLTNDAAKSGNAKAAYLHGQQLILNADRQEQARESLSVTLRLRHAPAAFAFDAYLRKLPAKADDQVTAPNSYRKAAARGCDGDTQSEKVEAIRWLRNATVLGHVQSIKKLSKMGLGAEGSSTAPATKVEDDGVEE
jgi:hypothetical protein